MPGESAFNRPKGIDKRLCKQVTSATRVPSNWTPMNLYNVECKLMEVRKYTHEYYDVESKFRHRNLQLITAYAVQNPFLLGCFMLRKEQLSLQLPHKVKERRLYYPTKFSELELIVRNNFCAVGGQIRFYESAKDADAAASENEETNPRVIIAARVITGTVHTISGGEKSLLRPNSGSTSVPFFSSADAESESGLPVDTVTDEDGRVFVKYHVNDVFPDHVIIYRNKDGPADCRTSRLNNVVKYCTLSYRAGTRFNPDEMTFKGQRRKKNDGEAAAAISAVATAETILTQQPCADVSEGGNDFDSKLQELTDDFSRTGAVPKRQNARKESHGKEVKDEKAASAEPEP